MTLLVILGLCREWSVKAWFGVEDSERVRQGEARRDDLLKKV